MTKNDLWAERTHAGHRVPRAWVHLLSAHAAMTRELNATLLASHGLTLTDYEVLLFLSWAPEGQLRRSDLASCVLLTQGGITRLLAGLERAGLVRSKGSDTDRRVVYSELTRKGREQLQRAAGDHVDEVDRMFTDRFSPAELLTLTTLLERLLGPTSTAR